MMPELDPSLLDFRPMDMDFGASKKDDPLNWNSQALSDPLSIEIGRHEPPRNERVEFDDDDDMNIDLDLDLGLDDGPSIEIGRRAPPPRSMEDLIDTGDKFENGLGYDDNTRTRLSSRVPSLVEDRDDEMLDNAPIPFNDDETFIMPINNGPRAPSAPADSRLQRDSQSPLSSARSSLVRDFDATNLGEDEGEASIRQANQRAKRRKLIQADADTMLSSTQIKQQQADRSGILKPVSFLSRDPVLLNLMNMQRNGGFVSSIMGDGRAKGWAPELKGILSIEVVRKSGELKRKRDSGIADVGEDDNQDEMPQLEIPEDDVLGPADEALGMEHDFPVREPTTMSEAAADGGILPGLDDSGAEIVGREDDEDDYHIAGENFDETTAPLLHPMEQGAISQGTRHAVHLLRDRFGSADDNSPSQQKKANILFQDMLPETRTTKVDATKMFFEVLVLATKDAVKVDQSDKEIGSSLRIRAKRGLWGAWAEQEAGGEIANPPTITAGS